jgi:AcrR family transcriptional regulator
MVRKTAVLREVRPGEPGPVEVTESDDRDAVEVAAATTHRPAGRPRSAAADEAILAATIQELITDGFDELTIERVATRAGVGKATIYRRWSSKMELVVDAVGSLKPPPVHPDTGSVRDDLVELLSFRSDAVSEPDQGRLLAGLCMELQRNDEIGDLYRGRFVTPRRQVMREILERSIERGEIRADIDPALVIDLLVAPLFYRRIVGDGDTDREAVARIVDQVLAGVSVPPGGNAASRSR